MQKRTYIPEMVLPDTFSSFPRPDFLKVRTKIESGGRCVCGGGGGGVRWISERDRAWLGRLYVR